MKVVVSSSGTDLDAAVSPIFGRSTGFVLVDTETMEASALPNPAVGASGGAGVQAAQFVLRHGAEAVISGNFGPNAAGALSASGIVLYAVEDGTVREAVEALKAGTLQPVGGSTVNKDYGKGVSRMGGGRGAGRGSGRGR